MHYQFLCCGRTLLHAQLRTYRSFKEGLCTKSTKANWILALTECLHLHVFVHVCTCLVLTGHADFMYFFIHIL